MAAIDSNKVVESEQPNEDNIQVTHLPKSAQEVFFLLQINGALKPREIGKYTDLSNRTIRYALRILMDDNKVRRVPDLSDLRSHFYAIN
ncbi:MAG: hypothetical protein ACFFC6_09705 [Promethearchaeota archaeon]